MKDPSNQKERTANDHQGKATTVMLILVTVVVVVVGVELGSWTLLSIASGDVVTWSSLAAARAIAKTADPETPPREIDWNEYQMRGHMVIHPFLGYVVDPSLYPGRTEEWFRRDVAEMGFPQNHHLILERESRDAVVVAVFGGSFANYLTTRSSGLVEALAALPRFSGRPIHVKSLALGGYKQPQQLMALSYLLGLGAEFDLVINIDGFNDIALPPDSTVAKGVFPFFPRGWPLFVADLAPETRVAIAQITAARSGRARLARRFSLAPMSHSMACGAVWTVLDRRWQATIAGLEATIQHGAGPGGSFQASGPRRSYTCDEEMYTDLADVWARCSLQMHGACAVNGIEYHHFLQPNQYLPGSKTLSDWELANAYDEDSIYRAHVEAGYPALIERGEWLRSRGVSFTDLTTAYSGVLASIYVDRCCHPNKLGQQIVSQRIAEVIGGDG